jgi:hypothetical protein
MVRGRVERRLAAILAGDVAGDLRMTGTDEERTLLRLSMRIATNFWNSKSPSMRRNRHDKSTSLR